MKEVRSLLLELQTLDNEILAAERALTEFEPRLAALDEPVRVLEAQSEAARVKLEELQQSSRRLEGAAEHKRERLKKYEARMERVRNLREESAARTEMDLIRGAAEADETEALDTMEQATRMDLRLDDLTRQLKQKREEVEPQRTALLAERQESIDRLAVLRDRRENHAIRMDKQTLRIYERIRGGLSRMAVAPLTDEGACGNCFNILPIQQQSEIRREDTLIRCEQCGVILYPSDNATA